MNKSPYINYLAPEVKVNIREYTFSEITFLEIDASCSEISGVCTIGLPMFINMELNNIKSGDVIKIEWGYTGYELNRIFTGIILKIEERKTNILIQAIDMSSLLVNTRVTKTYRDETPKTIIKSLIVEAGIKDYEIDDTDNVLKRLPLLNNNIIEAIYLMLQFLNSASNDFKFWFNEQGKFYFKKHGPENFKKHSGYMLEWGKNIISFKKLSSGFSGTFHLSTIGLPLHHSELINIKDKNNIEKTYFIKRVKHMLGPGKRGSRTTLWLPKVS